MEEGAAHVMRGEGRSMWIFGELMTHKVTAEQTGGAYSLFEVMSRPEGGRTAAPRPAPRGRVLLRTGGRVRVPGRRPYHQRGGRVTDLRP